MKRKIINLLLSAGLLLSLQTLKSQTGNSCAAAVPIPETSSTSAFTVSAGTTKWLAFSGTTKKLIFQKSENPNWILKNYQVYSGSCSALTLVVADTNT